MDVHLVVFWFTALLLLLACSIEIVYGSQGWDRFIRTDVEDAEKETGIRWAVLVAGSKGYTSYRNQADICHAYQILKKGGLKDENIVVFMYDDIAYNYLNPRPGVIINHPNGSDVYAGVPKDYTEKFVTKENLYAVLLGNKDGVKGGSGKVVNSKPNDRIFFFFSDHGGTGTLGMPNKPFIFADDFIEVLKKKHASGSYKEMVVYIDACEAGSMFEGLMPKDLNIYVTTASNDDESSWSIYCPWWEPYAPPEYSTCLGDLYSVAWMEDSETHNLNKETINQQYKAVKGRCAKDNISHVMEYGSMDFKDEILSLYQGFDPLTENFPPNKIQLNKQIEVVNQRDADLLSMWHTYKKLSEGSEKKSEILREIADTMRRRMHLDSSVRMIGVFLFGPKQSSSILTSVRNSGSPIVDDWNCLKSMVRMFETHCGSLTQYGMKHMRAFANICNSGVSEREREMEEACVAACSSYYNYLEKWSPLTEGYSA